MPAIAAFFISIILGAVGGFALQYFTDGISFIAAFSICSVCNLLSIGVFHQLNQQTTSSTSQKPKSTSKKQKQQADTPKTKKKQKPVQNKRPAASKPGSNSDFERGSVKWFNGNKGFGFICRDNGEEVFVHFRSIISNDTGRRNLRDGQEVEFRVVDSDRGPQAEDVSVL